MECYDNMQWNETFTRKNRKKSLTSMNNALESPFHETL